MSDNESLSRERRWAPLIGSGLPRDLAGQTALVVGWGPIGRGIAALLQALGPSVTAVRSGASNAAPAVATVPLERIAELLPCADWLVLACPLSARTRGLVDATALGLLPAGARLVNVARGEVVDEPALIDALRCGRLAGAYLDVFAHEPLPVGSPLWRLPNVLVTPHPRASRSATRDESTRCSLRTLPAGRAARRCCGRRRRTRAEVGPRGGRQRAMRAHGRARGTPSVNQHSAGVDQRFRGRAAIGKGESGAADQSSLEGAGSARRHVQWTSPECAPGPGR